MTKIEILSLEGCPNRQLTIDRVGEILRQESASADLVEVEITDVAMAEELGFLGSPSVRIDGRDIEPSARSSRAYGLGCRTYADEGSLTGVPPVEWIRAAVRDAQEQHQ